MKLTVHSARPSDRARPRLRHRAAALLSIAGLVILGLVSTGTGTASAATVHLPVPGAPVTIIIHLPHPHPECGECVD